MELVARMLHSTDVKLSDVLAIWGRNRISSLQSLQDL